MSITVGLPALGSRECTPKEGILSGCEKFGGIAEAKPGRARGAGTGSAWGTRFEGLGEIGGGIACGCVMPGRALRPTIPPPLDPATGGVGSGLSQSECDGLGEIEGCAMPGSALRPTIPLPPPFDPATGGVGSGSVSQSECEGFGETEGCAMPGSARRPTIPLPPPFDPATGGVGSGSVSQSECDGLGEIEGCAMPGSALRPTIPLPPPFDPDTGNVGSGAAEGFEETVDWDGDMAGRGRL
jgi:hypothetical protein